MTLTGRLLVVGTPLGNLGDFSPRAKEALKDADLILAEDTRHSRPLLDLVGSTAKMISCHQHNETERVGVVLERLEAGDTVALITDAGAPSVSDPGGRVVEAIADAGGQIEVVPGPSAPIAALMGAGVDATRFVFLGFLPRRGRGRVRLLTSAAESGHALVIFEAPNRVEETLGDLLATCGERRVVVARELTKKFETFHRGVLGGALTPDMVEKGEVVIVVEAGEETAIAPTGPTVEERAIALAVDGARSPRDRAKVLAAEFHLSRKDAYRRILEAAAAAESAGENAGDELEPESVSSPDALTSPQSKGGESADAESAMPLSAMPLSAMPLSAMPLSAMQQTRKRVSDVAVRTAPMRAEMAQALAVASRAMIDAYVAAGGAVAADTPVQDVLLAMDSGPRRLPAPAEEGEMIRALLGALTAAAQLDEGIEMMADALVASDA